MLLCRDCTIIAAVRSTSKYMTTQKSMMGGTDSFKVFTLGSLRVVAYYAAVSGTYVRT